MWNVELDKLVGYYPISISTAATPLASRVLLD